MEMGEEARRPTAGLSVARAYEFVRKELLTEFGADFFRAYIEPLRLVAEWNGSVLFRAGSRVAQDRLRQQVQHRLEARLRNYAPDLGSVDILLDQEFPEDVRALVDARIEEAQAQGRAAVRASALLHVRHVLRGRVQPPRFHGGADDRGRRRPRVSDRG